MKSRRRQQIAEEVLLGYGAMVEDDRVDSRLYTDADVFDLEVERIWRTCWIYVGHTSEVPRPGDYVTRDVALQPVILIRGKDDRVRVLLNRCPHRGNLVCSHRRGSSKLLRCAYHSWTFDTAGSLVGTPFPEPYGEGFDRAAAALRPAPRVDSHRGFVFACFDPGAPSLVDYLGAVAGYIDRYADLAPNGELDLSAGAVEVRVSGNWKMVAENNGDSYHPAFLHRSIMGSTGYLRKAMLAGVDGPIVARDVGGGHSMVDYSGQNRETGYVAQTVNAPRISDRVHAEYLERLSQRLGAARARELIADGTWPVNVFPNLMITWQDVRVVTPIGPGASSISHTPALLGGAPPEINLARLRQEVESYGPAGSVGADDIEMYDRAQLAFAATEDRTILLSRGTAFERVGDDGVVSGGPTDETAIRAFWRRYRELMG